MKVEEFQRHLRAMPGLITMAMEPAAAWTVMSALHLAIRHPQMPPDVKRLVASAAFQISTSFPPALQAVAALGLDPKYDVPNQPEVI